MKKNETFLDRIDEACKLSEVDLWTGYGALVSICSEIFLEISGRKFGEPIRVHVSETEIAIQKFMYDMSLFGDAKIPKDEWKDIAIKIIQLVALTIKAGPKTPQDFPEYDELKAKVQLRQKELEEDPRYKNAFNFFGF